MKTHTEAYPYGNLSEHEVFDILIHKGVFGGQLLSQALAAASRTVDCEKTVHSLHGYFLLAGDCSIPIIYRVSPSCSSARSTNSSYFSSTAASYISWFAKRGTITTEGTSFKVIWNSLLLASYHSWQIVLGSRWSQLKD
jgi:hypothetical protein